MGLVAAMILVVAAIAVGAAIVGVEVVTAVAGFLVDVIDIFTGD